MYEMHIFHKYIFFAVFERKLEMKVCQISTDEWVSIHLVSLGKFAMFWQAFFR